MARVKDRNYSTYTREACRLLGLLVRNSRKEKGMTVNELALRAGTSPSFVSRLEKGGLKGEIGVAFEVAFIAGVHLFVPEVSGAKAKAALDSAIRRAEDTATLLPKTIHKPSREELKDDF